MFHNKHCIVTGISIHHLTTRTTITMPTEYYNAIISKCYAVNLQPMDNGHDAFTTMMCKIPTQLSHRKLLL